MSESSGILLTIFRVMRCTESAHDDAFARPCNHVG